MPATSTDQGFAGSWQRNLPKAATVHVFLLGQTRHLQLAMPPQARAGSHLNAAGGAGSQQQLPTDPGHFELTLPVGHAPLGPPTARQFPGRNSSSTHTAPLLQVWLPHAI